MFARPTGDILILSLTLTVCFSLIASGLVVAIIAFVHPNKDLSLWVSRITGIINTMIGVIAGFLAGRTEMTSRKNSEEEPPPPPPTHP
jgi:uncharacterized membrane protein HdeD (DUF308 family)